MPAQRWRIVASGQEIETGWRNHGYSRHNRAANRYAALAMYRRRELDAAIRADIAAFDAGACAAALEIVKPGNPWRPVVEKRAAEVMSAHLRLALAAREACTLAQAA
jgi:hypothetical protein